MRRCAAIALAALLAWPAAAAAAASDPLRDQQWNLDLVEADAAHAIADGRGALVAVIDTGVNAEHPDLQGRLRPGYDFVQGDGTPQDGDGHGTHITGIVAANTGNGEGVESVAPGVSVLPIRVLDDNGEGFTSDVVAGIDFAISQGAHVINLSLSSSVPVVGDVLDPAFSAAVERALDRGIVVVAVAGNNALPVCENPVAQGRVLCVGAVDRRRMHSGYSSYGFGLALVAPGGSAAPTGGENVLSTYTAPSLYQEVGGTSQASPHVAGVAALLVSKGIRGQAAAQRILATATDVGLPGPDFTFGAGIVNARRAVEGLPPDDPSAPGGSPGDPPPAGSAARVSVPRVQRLRTVLRRGILVRCRAAGSGRCVATAALRGRRVARGSAELATGRTRSFRARLTRRGRRVLERAGRRTRVRVTVSLPGAGPQRRTVTLKR